MSFQPTLTGLHLCPTPQPATSPQVLWNFPDISPEARQRHARALGQAGEALCDSLLLRYGLLPMVPPDHLPFDRLLTAGDLTARVQIKTTAVPTNGIWSFSLKKGYQGSPGGTRAYAPGDFDIAALVCLSENSIIFTTQAGPWFRFSQAEVAAAARDPRATLEQSLNDLGLSPPPSLPCAQLAA